MEGSTRLYNRRCYEENLDKYRDGKPLEDDFVLFSLDVNGQKKANDTLGHNAGDELKHLADTDMYAEKERYYKERQHDRRRR